MRKTDKDREEYVARLRELADLVEAGTIPTPLSTPDVGVFLPAESRQEDVDLAVATITALGGKWKREHDHQYARYRGRTPKTGQPVTLWINGRTPPEGINLLTICPPEYRSPHDQPEDPPVNLTGRDPEFLADLTAAEGLR